MQHGLDKFHCVNACIMQWKRAFEEGDLIDPLSDTIGSLSIWSQEFDINIQHSTFIHKLHIRFKYVALTCKYHNKILNDKQMFGLVARFLESIYIGDVADSLWNKASFRKQLAAFWCPGTGSHLRNLNLQFF